MEEEVQLDGWREICGEADPTQEGLAELLCSFSPGHMGRHSWEPDEPTSTLADYLDDSVQIADPAGFTITDAKLANWALRKLTQIRRLAAEDRAVAEAEMKRIDEWLQGRLVKYGRDETFFTQHLRGFHERRLAEDPKAKTISLPNGELVARKAPDRWVLDEEEVLPWAKEQGLTRVIPEQVAIDKNALKKRLTAKGDQAVDPDSGELVPGVTIEQGQTTFSVRVKDGD